MGLEGAFVFCNNKKYNGLMGTRVSGSKGEELSVLATLLLCSHSVDDQRMYFKRIWNVGLASIATNKSHPLNLDDLPREVRAVYLVVGGFQHNIKSAS